VVKLPELVLNMVMWVGGIFVRAVQLLALAAVLDPQTDAHVALLERQAL
jgi:hypothetical protein